VGGADVDGEKVRGSSFVSCSSTDHLTEEGKGRRKRSEERGLT
jgi:hypothetical protein